MGKIKDTKGLCVKCEKAVPAEITERDGRVFFKKTCPEHGSNEVLLSSNADWYRRTMNYSANLVAPAKTKKESSEGCPLDCGYCGNHKQRIFLPVVPVTSACNLNCPVCYTINKNSSPYYMPKDEFARLLEKIHEQDPGMQIINFTGGEPTLHPEFCSLVEMCRDAGIHRITVSTNGLRLLEDEEMLPRLVELDTRIVLSFNSFRPEPYNITAGADLLEKKLRVLELLEKYKPSTSLLTVVANGVNESEIGGIVRYIMDKDHIVSSEIHTVTFTGENAASFDHRTRTTTYDVIADVVANNPGVKTESFVPSPCAHPMCYSTCYMLKLDDGEYVPFTDFMSGEDMASLLAGNLYIEPGPVTEEILGDTVNNLWSNLDQDETGKKILSSLRNLLLKMYSSTEMSYADRQKISERATKAIYIHSHMDEENFDIERIEQCSGAVPYEGGLWIPTCAYNNIYRARDARFCKSYGG